MKQWPTIWISVAVLGTAQFLHTDYLIFISTTNQNIRGTIIHEFTVSLCNSSNSLRRHKQQWKLHEQLWAEQLCTCTNLDPLHLSLCIGSNSLRLHEQRNNTVRTVLSGTAPTSVKTSCLQTAGRVMTGGSQDITDMLLVTGAAYRLIRDFVYLHYNWQR